MQQTKQTKQATQKLIQGIEKLVSQKRKQQSSISELFKSDFSVFFDVNKQKILQIFQGERSEPIISQIQILLLIQRIGTKEQNPEQTLKIFKFGTNLNLMIQTILVNQPSAQLRIKQLLKLVDILNPSQYKNVIIFPCQIQSQITEVRFLAQCPGFNAKKVKAKIDGLKQQIPDRFTKDYGFCVKVYSQNEKEQVEKRLPKKLHWILRLQNYCDQLQFQLILNRLFIPYRKQSFSFNLLTGQVKVVILSNKSAVEVGLHYEKPYEIIERWGEYLLVRDHFRTTRKNSLQLSGLKLRQEGKSTVLDRQLEVSEDFLLTSTEMKKYFNQQAYLLVDYSALSCCVSVKADVNENKLHCFVLNLGMLPSKGSKIAVTMRIRNKCKVRLFWHLAFFNDQNVQIPASQRVDLQVNESTEHLFQIANQNFQLYSKSCLPLVLVLCTDWENPAFELCFYSWHKQVRLLQHDEAILMSGLIYSRLNQVTKQLLSSVVTIGNLKISGRQIEIPMPIQLK